MIVLFKKISYHYRVCLLLIVLFVGTVARGQEQHVVIEPSDTTGLNMTVGTNGDLVVKGDSATLILVPARTLRGAPVAGMTDSVSADPFSGYDVWQERPGVFNPSPTRAVWLSALFPGLGQVYNRRYWKLPLIVGGYLGLGYATSWNNKMLNDYQRAYRDIMDSDPDTKSYMDFFPPTTSESDLDKQWLTNLLKSRKDFYRRNRDLCIIGMVGVYLLAMVDAYVDASLSHFDLSPDLSMDVVPTLIQDGRSTRPGFGLCWALNF